MKHHQFKTIVESILVFTKERNSPRESDALCALWQTANEYISSTTSRPVEVAQDLEDDS